jgi:uncharacterized linocin/CFP29 family protein
VNHLLRERAPITDEAWAAIDEEARQRLVPALAARKLVDFAGPLGWTHSAMNLGRSESVTDGVTEGVSARRRRVLAHVEVRAGFAVERDELADIDRGAKDFDLEDLDRAAQLIARTENVAVFHGWSAAGLRGIAEVSPYPAISLGESFAGYPSYVARAVETLLEAGVSGPYGIALGPDNYTGVVESTEHGGLVVFDHLREILGGPIVFAPGVKGAVVVSLRGGDFLFESGEDISVGYEHHDAATVSLYLEESFGFLVASPDAAVVLSS